MNMKNRKQKSRQKQAPPKMLPKETPAQAAPPQAAFTMAAPPQRAPRRAAPPQRTSRRAAPPKEKPPKETAPKKAQTFTVRVVDIVKRRFVVFSLLAAVALAALCTRSYIVNKAVGMANIAFNYESASKGLAPNNTRFSMYDFKSDEILSHVIAMGALDGVTINDLSQCIGLSARGGGGSDYISTEVYVTVNTAPIAKLGARLDARSLTSLYIKACETMFHDKYVSRADVLVFDYAGVDDYEYLELSDYYTMKLNLLNRYVAARVNEHSTFRSTATGLTFREIQERISNLKSTKLANMRAYVGQTGVTKNKDLYLSKLAYLNYNRDKTYRQQFSEYSVRLSNIKDYNILQTAVVMVPTYDDRGSFYMSMTKTGIDDVAIDAQAWNEAAAETLLKISQTEAVIDSVRDSASTGDEVRTVEAMIREIREEMTDLTELTLLTDGDYIAYKMDDYITITQGELSIIEKIAIKKNILPAFAFYAALWCIQWNIAARRKKAVA